jgi:hypothetical protein
MVSATRGAGVPVVAFLWAEVAMLSAASLVHGGLLISGYAHAQARTAEAVIALVLLLALATSAFLPGAARQLALAAQVLALLGMLLGVSMIFIGIGPQSLPDLVYHFLLVALLLAGLNAASTRGR